MARADPQRPFVHQHIQTAYSVGGTSPSLPEDYVRALARQHPLDARTSDAERIYLVIADYGLHSAVKAAVACARAGIEHIPGLRVRVVPERGKRTFFDFTRTHIDVGEAVARGHHPNWEHDLISGHLYGTHVTWS
jgi:DNA polymerase III alpha subunit